METASNKIVTVTSLQVVVLVVSLCGWEVTTQDTCTSYGSDCRAPFGLDTAYETVFNPICQLHSICYSCGADVGVTKAECDEALRTKMNAACAPLPAPDLCRFQADNVFALQTRVIGTNYYHQLHHTAAWCIQHGITDCLPSPGLDLNRRCTVLVWAALALLLLLPVCEGQRFPQQVPFQSLQPFIPMAEFFCQWTPRLPAAVNQQQCVTAFNALNLQPNVYNFCLSVVTFCTASHLTLCPRPATATACRTCFPVFQQLCQQQG